MFDLPAHIEARTTKRKTPYVLGSIWMRRDGKRAVIVSEEESEQVLAIVVSDPRVRKEVPYLLFAATGRVSRDIHNSPMDLIYRDED